VKIREFVKQIRAPRASVFTLATDFSGAAAVIGAIEKVEMLTEGPVRSGTRFLETRRVLGAPTTQEVEVTVYDPPTRYALQCESHGSRYVTRVELEPNGSGTNVTMGFEVEPVSFMAKAMAQTIQPMLEAAAQALEQDLDDLKARLEVTGDQKG
jgi:carbon monoxide dehydrogenase subunit G